MVVDAGAREAWATLPFIAEGASGLSERLLLLAPNFLCIPKKVSPGRGPPEWRLESRMAVPEAGHHPPSLSRGLRATTAALPSSYNTPNTPNTPTNTPKTAISTALCCRGKVTATALGCSNTPAPMPLNQRGLLPPVGSERGNLA